MDISIYNAFRHYKSRENAHLRIYNIEDTNEDSLYYYKMRGETCIVSIIVNDNIFITRHAQIDGAHLVMCYVQKSHNKSSCTLLLKHQIMTLEYVDKEYNDVIARAPNVIARVPNVIARAPNVIARAPNVIARAQNVIARAPNVITMAVEETTVEPLACSICMTNKKQICLTCGHMFCSLCASKLTGECFICKKTYINMIKVFL